MRMNDNPRELKRGAELPYLEDFLLNLQTNNFSQETVYNYERDLRLFAFFLKYDARLSFVELSKAAINRYKAYLNSKDRKTPTGAEMKRMLSPNSINRMLSSLRRYLKYMVDMDFPVPIAPEAIKLTKTPRRHPRVAEFDLLVKLIELPSEAEKEKSVALRNRAMLEVLFATGMRISELVSLNRSQIDATGRIFIRGKGKKERFVYLTERAQKWLKKYLAVRRDDHPALFVPLRGRNVDTTKSRISPNYLQMKIKEYRERLGINVPTSAHSLRHGFATYLAEKGASPAAIQILLGHESLHTTTRYINASDKFAEKSHRDFHPLKD